MDLIYAGPLSLQNPFSCLRLWQAPIVEWQIELRPDRPDTLNITLFRCCAAPLLGAASGRSSLSSS